MEIPEPVRQLALYPFSELPVPPSVTEIEGPGATLLLNKHPGARIVRPQQLSPAQVPAAVEWTRATAREHGVETLAWWLGPDDDALGAELEPHAIVNADTPGFEAIENGLALLEPPSVGEMAEVEVRVVETWEDFVAGRAVPEQAFGLPATSDEQAREQFDDYVADDSGRAFIALLGEQVVGAAYAAFATAGLNLFGGSVLPEARGKGVYRTLLRARWDFAVERGTPALTVQAGRMARPICERMGFRFLGAARVFVDTLS